MIARTSLALAGFASLLYAMYSESIAIAACSAARSSASEIFSASSGISCNMRSTTARSYDIAASRSAKRSTSGPAAEAEAVTTLRSGFSSDISSEPFEDPAIEFLRVCGPADLFGEMACMNFYPRSATVLAETDVVAFEMLRNVLDIMMKNRSFRAEIDQNYRRQALENHLRGVLMFAELLWRKTCSECHVMTQRRESRTPGELPWLTEGPADILTHPIFPDILIAADPRRRLPHAKFDHQARRGFSCVSCHEKAQTSTEISDVLLPGIATSKTCHAPGPEHAESRCFECHTYHDWAKRKEVKATFTLPSLRKTGN
jgi:CRP-like cAMP-binding protein